MSKYEPSPDACQRKTTPLRKNFSRANALCWTPNFHVTKSRVSTDHPPMESWSHPEYNVTMARRSKICCICKWAGLVVCILILLAWAISGRFHVEHIVCLVAPKYHQCIPRQSCDHNINGHCEDRAIGLYLVYNELHIIPACRAVGYP